MSSNENLFSRDLFSPEEVKDVLMPKHMIDEFNLAFSDDQQIMVCKTCSTFVKPNYKKFGNKGIMCLCPYCHEVLQLFQGW